MFLTKGLLSLVRIIVITIIYKPNKNIVGSTYKMTQFLKTKTITKTVAVAGLWAMAATAGAVTWNMPTGYPESNYHTQNIHRFADAVTTATGGDLTIKVHSGGSLFKGNEIKRAVQTGQAFIAERILSAHANELPILSTDSVPFLATSFEESKLLWEASKDIINEQLAKQNLKILYSVMWPPQGFYAKKPLNKVEDFKGLRMRGYNTVTSAVSKALEAEPLQIEYAELSQALATGVADSFVSSGSSGYDVKAWETLSHYNDFRAWLPRNHVIVNLSEWNKLPQETRDTVEAIAELTEHAANQEAQNLTNWYMDQFRKNGMTVVKADESLRADLADRTKHLLDDYLESSGEDGQRVLDKYMELKAKAGM